MTKHKNPGYLALARHNENVFSIKLKKFTDEILLNDFCFYVILSTILWLICINFLRGIVVLVRESVEIDP